MDREKSLTLLWPEWGSIPIPFDPQSEIQPIAPQACARHSKGVEFLLLLYYRHAQTKSPTSDGCVLEILLMVMWEGFDGGFCEELLWSRSTD
jgi:hypothetical protein